MMRSRRLFLSLLFSLLSAPASAQRSVPDPYFETVHFDRWVAEGERVQIPWKVHISDGELSQHQRLRVTVTIQVDGRELVKRPHEGQLVMLVQFNDSQGRTYQNHAAMELKDVNRGVKSQDIVFTQDAFVIPGEYPVSLAIFDSVTEEHSLTRRTLRVAPLKSDPLPEAGRDLPPVVLYGEAETPEAWFLPSMPGRLHLPLDTKRPVRIQLLMNLPSSSSRFYKANMGALLPAFKVLSQVDVRNGSLQVAMLDLVRRRVSFEQDAAKDLDWDGLKTALKEANPNVIDVQSLANRKQNAEFFLNQVGRRISASEGAPLNVLIVLSSPMTFAEEDRHQIRLDDKPDSLVFYIRYSTFLTFEPSPTVQQSPSGSRRGQGRMIVPMAQQDSLEPLLKPIKPRLFDVASPEQFRRALSAILAEISR